nr:deoxycytidinylate deaminase [uncultured phage]CAI9752254.1 deoxycytidinylate deaminase [uncultured phage]
MDVAKAVSKTSDYHGAHLGCVVTYGKNVLSVASNSEKTHTLQRIYNRYRDFNPDEVSNKLHSEVHALSWLIGKDIDWSGVEIYVYREFRNGHPAISKPCPACANLIKDLGIKTMFYIDDKGQRVKEKVE